MGVEAFGGALLISDRAASQKEAAERAFARPGSDLKVWQLSARERKIIEELNTRNDESPAGSHRQGFSL